MNHTLNKVFVSLT